MPGIKIIHNGGKSILEVPLTLLQGCDGCVYLYKVAQVGLRWSAVGYSYERSACAPLERFLTSGMDAMPRAPEPGPWVVLCIAANEL